MTEKQKNVLGEDLEECSKNPLTGWFRDGCCNTDKNDVGMHTVCLKVNDKWPSISLSSPFRPQRHYLLNFLELGKNPTVIFHEIPENLVIAD